MQDQCPFRAACNTAPDHWVIPRPDPATVTMLENVNRDSSPFLCAAGITRHSVEHKELMKTIQVLHRQRLDAFKYLEEQAPGSVDQLIAQARARLPWLNKYEDSWPARVYLKRYVDGRRPHLMCSTEYAKSKQAKAEKSRASRNIITRNLGLRDPDDALPDDSSILQKFLGSLTPSLEHHFDAFVTLGIKDQGTLLAFLSWPQAIQAQFLDEGHGTLQLTSLERTSLLVGCGLLTQQILTKQQPEIGTFI